MGAFLAIAAFIQALPALEEGLKEIFSALANMLGALGQDKAAKAVQTAAAAVDNAEANYVNVVVPYVKQTYQLTDLAIELLGEGRIKRLWAEDTTLKDEGLDLHTAATLVQSAVVSKRQAS